MAGKRKRKDPAAVSLGKKRAAKLKRKDPKGMAKLGALGGQTRADKLTAEQRSASAKKAAAARWRKKEEKG